VKAPGPRAPVRSNENPIRKTPSPITLIHDLSRSQKLRVVGRRPEARHLRECRTPRASSSAIRMGRRASNAPAQPKPPARSRSPRNTKWLYVVYTSTQALFPSYFRSNHAKILECALRNFSGVHERPNRGRRLRAARSTNTPEKPSRFAGAGAPMLDRPPGAATSSAAR